MVLMLILNSKSHMLKTNLDLMKVDISIPNMTDNDDTIRGGQKMALFVDVIKQRSPIYSPQRSPRREDLEMRNFHIYNH